MNLCIRVGARGSTLSKKQVLEVLQELQSHHPHVSFDPIWITTTGDKDQKSSLRHMENSDFFTKEIDQALLEGSARIAIHSAKDLPSKLTEGLTMVALTKGLDPSDSLVLASKKRPKRIATSSLRREAGVRSLYPEAEVVDIRGNIEQRLSALDEGSIDGLVVAECALIRLGLTALHRIKLDCPVAHFQGQLAVIAREGDREMAALFGSIDTRKR